MFWFCTCLGDTTEDLGVPCCNYENCPYRFWDFRCSFLVLLVTGGAGVDGRGGGETGDEEGGRPLFGLFRWLLSASYSNVRFGLGTGLTSLAGPSGAEVEPPEIAVSPGLFFAFLSFKCSCSFTIFTFSGLSLGLSKVPEVMDRFRPRSTLKQLLGS